jgi:vacuolar-type H+-ATPase subunit C/Vma6
MNQDALLVRAAGLSAHLLPRETLTRLAAVPDLAALGRELAALGVPLPAQQPSAADIELGLRRRAAAQLRTLARWDTSGAVVPVLMAEFERRALRALVRGLVEGVGSAARLEGVLPTPGFPERALQELAKQPAFGGLVALLTTWRSPWAPALAELHGNPPDLVEVELALARALAMRLQAAGKRAGGVLRDYVRESLDLENLAAALLLAGGELERAPETHFHSDGAWLDQETFRAAATAESRSLAASGLAAACPVPALAERIVVLAEDPVALERGLAAWRRGAWSTRARLEPLSAAPLLAYVLSLEAETRTLQRLVWATALGAPANLRLAAEEAA